MVCVVCVYGVCIWCVACVVCVYGVCVFVCEYQCSDRSSFLTGAPSNPGLPIGPTGPGDPCWDDRALKQAGYNGHTHLQAVPCLLESLVVQGTQFLPVRAGIA